MASLLQQAILKTIIYADIFDYPLTWEEIEKWLIKLKIKNEKLKITMQNSKLLGKKDGFYFLKGREEVVNLRKKRKKWSKEKFKIAQSIATLLKSIPTVRLVGVTGALVVNNSKKDDDIDLFVVTSKGLLWTTRLFVTSLIEVTGRRRHPTDSNVNNKICLNMFVDEDHLEVPKKEQDIFSAHEVLQMKPIWEKDRTYQKFLSANQWVKRYLPNAWVEVIKKIEIKKLSTSSDFSPNYLITQLLNYFEFFLKKFQLWYMRNRRTSEVMNEGIIRFHPQDAREWVMREYKKRRSNLLVSSRKISN